MRKVRWAKSAMAYRPAQLARSDLARSGDNAELHRGTSEKQGRRSISGAKGIIAHRDLRRKGILKCPIIGVMTGGHVSDINALKY